MPDPAPRLGVASGGGTVTGGHPEQPATTSSMAIESSWRTDIAKQIVQGRLWSIAAAGLATARLAERRDIGFSADFWPQAVAGRG